MLIVNFEKVNCFKNLIINMVLVVIIERDGSDF